MLIQLDLLPAPQKLGWEQLSVMCRRNKCQAGKQYVCPVEIKERLFMVWKLLEVSISTDRI